MTKKEERKRSTESDIIVKTEHSVWESSSSRESKVRQVLQRILILQYSIVLVENKVWKQGCGLASEWPT